MDSSEKNGKCAADKHYWVCQKCPLVYVDWAEGKSDKKACKSHHEEHGWHCKLCKTVFDFKNGITFYFTVEC